MLKNNMTIYCIGLDGDPDDPLDISFLQQLANTSNSPSFNPALPVGDALLATNSSQLVGVFQEVANKILTRLTQ